jgi:hypothetical protein
VERAIPLPSERRSAILRGQDLLVREILIHEMGIDVDG